MTLTRYQIRNEYGLGDKELYQAVSNKEDPEALLEGASMAALVGVLRQLGDLAEFAAEVFHCLHEELMTTASRGHGLAMRLQHLEAESPSVEIPILSQTHHSTFFYDPGLEWHSDLQTQESLISSRNLPHCIMDSYEECRAPPQLFLLDKFDVVGSGSCLKRYSDPSLLKSVVVVTSKLSREERPRKPKLQTKRSHQTCGETPENSSHAKLHQLFSLEHVEKGHRDLEVHVKLKRRQLDGPPVNSSSGTSYMEKFLKNQSSPAKCSVGEDLPIPSMVYPNGEDARNHNGRQMESIADDETLEKPFVLQEIMANEKCLERSSLVNLCCKANNDTDALASAESEAMEAESDDKAGSNLVFPGFGQTKICTNADVAQTEVLAQFCNVLHHSSEGGESSLLCTNIQRASPESEPHNAEGSAVKIDVPFSQRTPEHDHSQHVFSVETESEISLSALVEDQFSSITNQEIEALGPEDISFEAGHSILDSKNSLLETPAALESDCLLQNQHMSTFDNFEDLSLADDSQYNAAPKEEETISQDISSMNTEQSVAPMSDAPRDLHTGNGNLSNSSWQEDALANLDLDEISSDSGQEDPQTMSVTAADSSEPEVAIPDTQIHGTCFVGEVNHDNQIGQKDKASETVSKSDLKNISDADEGPLGTQECFSPTYCIQIQDQRHPISVESLPPQDVPLGIQGSPSEEALICNEKLLPSNLTETEALHSPHQESFTSLSDHISESVLSIDLTDDQENCLDVSMVPFSAPFHETPQTDSEITPPLPPLPPTQWWMGKLVETNFSPVPSLVSSGNHNFHVYTEESVSSSAQTALNEPSQATEEQSPLAVNGISDDESTQNCLNKAAEESFASVSLVTAEAESVEGLEADWRSEAMALEWFSQNLREHTNPNSAKLEEGSHELDHPLEPCRETEFPQSLRDSNSYAENEKVEKLLRDKDPLVIGIDRSMLRKVSERSRTQVGDRVDENESLLEIIRNKSFNLRPADASVRPNFQVAVPITNLKVAAILERANTLRQAMAGSDDDHDSDSWSE